MQHKLSGFYNRDEKCLLRGTDWILQSSTLPMFIKLACRLSSCLLVQHLFSQLTHRFMILNETVRQLTEQVQEQQTNGKPAGKFL